MDWPGNSPDLNPIENLWLIMKGKLKKKDNISLLPLLNRPTRSFGSPCPSPSW
jgi:transposase